MSYITNSDVQTFLETTFTTPEGNAMTPVLSALELAANAYMGRSFGAGPQTEYFDGNTHMFVLSKGPATAITSIEIDDQAIEADDIHNYGNYVKLDYRANPGHQNVKIVYTCSADVPADVKQALVQWAANIFKSHKEGGKSISRVSIGPMSVDYKMSEKASEMPDFVRMVLDSYKLIAVI